MSLFNPCPDCQTPIPKGMNCPCGFKPGIETRPVEKKWCYGPRCTMPLFATGDGCLWHYMTKAWTQPERTFEVFRDKFLAQFGSKYPGVWDGKPEDLWEKVGGNRK